jgi:hypothetical protein
MLGLVPGEHQFGIENSVRRGPDTVEFQVHDAARPIEPVMLIITGERSGTVGTRRTTPNHVVQHSHEHTST